LVADIIFLLYSCVVFSLLSGYIIADLRPGIRVLSINVIGNRSMKYLFAESLSLLR
jgi:hypothetical protein